MKIAALSIEGSMLRATLCHKGLGSTRVMQRLELALPPDPIDRRTVLLDNLISWRQQHAITAVIAGLEPVYFTHAMVSLPVTAEKDIRSALHFEMEKHLPLPPEEYYFDFHVLSKAVATEEAEAGSLSLVLSVRKDRIQWIISAVADAGLKLLGMRSSALEAAGAVSVTHPSGTSALLYEGSPESAALAMILLKSGQPVAFKVIKHTESETRTVAATLEEYEGTNRLLRISTRGDASVVLPEGTSPADVSFDLPEHLAISSFRKLPFRLDFMPARPVVDHGRYLWPAAMALSVLCVAVFFMTEFTVYYRDYAALKDVRSRLAAIQSTSREMLELRARIEGLEKKRKFLEEFKNNRARHVHTLRQLSNILPSDAWLSSFTAEENGTVKIEGYARRTADIVAPLEKSAIFENIRYASPVVQRRNQERFSIRMEVQQ